MPGSPRERRPGPRTAGSSRSRPEGEAAGDPAAEARLAFELAARQREQIDGSGSSACSTRSRCR